MGSLHEAPRINSPSILPAFAPQVKPQAVPPAPPSLSPSPEQMAQQLQEALAKIRELEKAQSQAVVSGGSVAEPPKPNMGNKPAPEHDGPKNGVPTQKTRDDQSEDAPMVTPMGKRVPQFIYNNYICFTLVYCFFIVLDFKPAKCFVKCPDVSSLWTRGLMDKWCLYH